MPHITNCMRCTGLYEASSEETANEPGRLCPTCSASGAGRQTLTLFQCGPSRCKHDYSLYQIIDGGETAVCVKCGARAIDEAVWE